MKIVKNLVLQKAHKGKVISTISLIFVALLSFLLQPVFADALSERDYQQGVEHFNNAEYSQAYSIFDELKSELKSNAEFQFYYGLSLLKTDQAKQAVKVMERATKLDPGKAEYHYALARVYKVRAEEINYLSAVRMAGKYRKSLRRAIELDPQHTGAVRALAYYLLDFPSIVGGDDKAGQELLVTLREMDKAAAAMVGGRAENKENFELVEKLFLTAINTPGTSNSSGSSVCIHARISLAQLYIIKKKYSKAIPYLQQSLSFPRHWSETSDAYEGHMFLAVAYYHLDDEINFNKHHVAAEKATVNKNQRKDIEGWFKYFKVKEY